MKGSIMQLKEKKDSVLNLKVILIFIGIAVMVGACSKNKDPRPIDAAAIGWVTEAMTSTMVHDVTNPPLAARFYAYSCLSGYETLSSLDEEIVSFSGMLNDLPSFSSTEEVLPQNYHPVAAILAMLETSAAMQPSGDRINEFKKVFLDSCAYWGYEQTVLDQAEGFAKHISDQVLAYAKKDKYREISNYPRYKPKPGDGYWYPTPPGYFTPVEPYFNTIRPFILSSGDQFKPEPPAEFSTTPDSPFFRMMKEVYEVDLKGENRSIAAFWDCNPFALEESGHLMVGIKQISPGGHWMGITDIACRKKGLDFSKSMEISTLVAVGVMDGFISCWDEKYRSNRIRPETAIRKYVDPSYTPMLQTPPFPEYLSGHSTISTTSAVILTHFFGEDFAYTDTVEEQYGLGTRDYKSFMHASEEASISRLYGGIHFMDAIVNGQKQGTKVGNFLLAKYQEHMLPQK